MRIVNLIFGAIIFICAIYVSFNHSLFLFEIGGYVGYLAIAGVIAGETLYAMGIINTVNSLMSKTPAPVSARIATIIGTLMVGWANIYAGWKKWMIEDNPIGIILGVAIMSYLWVADWIIVETLSQFLKKDKKTSTLPETLPVHTNTKSKVDTTSVDTKLVDVKTVDVKSVDATSVDVKTVDTKNVDTKSVDVKSVDVISVDMTTVDTSTVDVDVKNVDMTTVDTTSVDTTADAINVDTTSVDTVSVDIASTANKLTVDTTSVDATCVDTVTVDVSTVDTTSVDTKPVDIKSVDVDVKSVDVKNVDKTNVDKKSVDTISVDVTNVDKASVDKANVDTSKEDIKVDTMNVDATNVDTKKRNNSKVVDLASHSKRKKKDTEKEIERVLQYAFDIKEKEGKFPGRRRIKNETGCSEYIAKEAKRILDELEQTG